MRRHCEEEYPSEACGIVIGFTVGDERRVAEAVPCCNAASNALRRYSIDPIELIRVQKQARANGLEIIGFYHSHPGHPAEPSPTDLEDAHWIGCSYVIMSVVQGKATDTRSFLLSGTRDEDKSFSEEHLVIG
jgi:proteasome lid subunit RPN8/RPN11